MQREMLKMAERFDNVRITPWRLATIWGGASLQQMLLRAMQDLHEMSDWHWDFFVNLSESDYPFKWVYCVAFLSFLSLPLLMLVASGGIFVSMECLSFWVYMNRCLNSSLCCPKFDLHAVVDLNSLPLTLFFLLWSMSLVLPFLSSRNFTYIVEYLTAWRGHNFLRAHGRTSPRWGLAPLKCYSGNDLSYQCGTPVLFTPHSTQRDSNHFVVFNLVCYVRQVLVSWFPRIWPCCIRHSTALSSRAFFGVHRFIRKQGLDQTFYECEHHMWRIGPRALPNGIHIDGGSDWFMLNRQYVDYLVSSQDQIVLALKHMFHYTLLPAEVRAQVTCLCLSHCFDVCGSVSWTAWVTLRFV